MFGPNVLGNVETQVHKSGLDFLSNVFYNNKKQFVCCRPSLREIISLTNKAAATGTAFQMLAFSCSKTFPLSSEGKVPEVSNWELL